MPCAILPLSLLTGRTTLCSAGTAFWAVGNKRSTELDVLKVVAALFTASMFMGAEPNSATGCCVRVFAQRQQLAPFDFDCGKLQTDSVIMHMLQASTTQTRCSQWSLRSVLCTIESDQQVMYICQRAPR